jgi:hypothetical protein
VVHADNHGNEEVHCKKDEAEDTEDGGKLSKEVLAIFIGERTGWWFTTSLLVHHLTSYMVGMLGLINRESRNATAEGEETFLLQFIQLGPHDGNTMLPCDTNLIGDLTKLQ